jgi:syntaxin 8
MANPPTHPLLLLADHLKLSLLERQRALALKLDASKQNSQITKSLSSLHQGLEQLESEHASDPNLPRIRQQYTDLYTQFHGSAPPTSQTTQPNDLSLAPDFEAAQQTRPTKQTRRTKSVRFRDNPSDEEDAATTASRAALFASQTQSYTDDDPASASQTNLSNNQIHTYHKQVLRDQDTQLDTLAQSIGRQRMLGIQMGTELDEQNELLTDVESGVDRHQSTLDRARKRLGNVARKSKGNWSWITIGILILVLVLLIVVLK